ncbi:MAG: hypothetical protein PHR25_05905 [Clostridia bacterium]|nr:hypothetical protein [Clostridia bacterium]
MILVDWNKFKTNSNESKELAFEHFNYVTAYILYKNIGTFEYNYNTPGSEFYLTLKSECSELSAKTEDVVGWQVKYWNDGDNTSLRADRRLELVEGFKKSIDYKPNLCTWIICLPGQPSNTKPHCVRDTLIADLKAVKSDINIIFWNKEEYNKFFLANASDFLGVASHYFGENVILYDSLKNCSLKNQKYLKEKFDVDLYTKTEHDDSIFNKILFEKMSAQIEAVKSSLCHSIGEYDAICKKEIAECENASLKKKLETYLISLGKANNKIFSCLKDEQLDNLNDLITEYNFIKQSVDNDSDLALNFRVTQINRTIVSNINDWIEIIRNKKCKNINIFGEAGKGKTNLVCNISNQIIKLDKPVILLLASSFSASIPSNLKSQIVMEITGDSTITFSQLIKSIDLLGLTYNIKVPFIIDGLNETLPTASVWNKFISDMDVELNNYENIIFITTSRNSYCKQIFGTEEIADVKNNYITKGFTQSNIGKAINKYFNKYSITPLNQYFDKNIFENPLLLKIFCEVNRGKEIIIDNKNIYQTIEDFISQKFETVTNKNGDSQPHAIRDLKSHVSTLCKCLWENNSRDIDFPDKFCEIFNICGDVNVRDVPGYKLIDEGLFFSREMQNNIEKAGFSYDFIAGFCIARNVILNQKKEDIYKFLKSDEFRDKILNAEHPLYEDILSTIIYYSDTIIGEPLYNIIAVNSMIIKHYVRMLDTMYCLGESYDQLQEYLLSEEIDEEDMKFLLDTILTGVLQKKYFHCEFLLKFIKKLNHIQIDLLWSEIIRKHRIDIIKHFEAEDKDSVENVEFVMLLLSSSDRYIRDYATYKLVLSGRKQPNIILEVVKKIINIDDIYIIERVFAILCGVILSSNDKDFIFKVCNFIEDNLKRIKTNHILILDYANTIFNYASENFNREKTDVSKCVEISSWDSDKKCNEELTERDATWGYEFIDMDFASHVIEDISKGYDQKKEKAPSLKECISMIYKKIIDYGYDKEKFEGVELDIRNQRTNYNDSVNGLRIERYAKKYSWIAFFELYGTLILTNRILPEENTSNLYRTTRVDIDPTFPSKPKRESVLAKSILPENNKVADEWFKENVDYYFDKYVRNNYTIVHGRIIQEKEEEGITSRVSGYITTYIVNRDEEFLCKRYLEEQNMYDFNGEYYYLFAGELPWSDNIIPDIEMTNCSENIFVQHTASWYNWEPYHSEFNNIGGVPLLSPILSRSLNLKFNLQDFSYYDDKNNIVSKLISSDKNSAVYLDSNVLQQYLDKNNKSLLLYCNIEKIVYDKDYTNSKRNIESYTYKYNDEKFYSF